MIRKGPGTTIDIPGFEAPNVVGVIFRYYLYRPISKGGNEVIEKIYENKGTNPATLRSPEPSPLCTPTKPSSPAPSGVS